MLDRQSVLRATLTVIVACGTLLAATNCANRQSTAPPATTAAASTVHNGARLATGSAATGCGGLKYQGLVFGVHSDGTLWGYPSARMPDGCVTTWLPESQLGDGWDTMRRVFADHNTTDNQYPVFGIDNEGDLHWYAYDPRTKSWLPGSGAVIGTGWNQLKAVTYAGDGVFYAVADTGELLWYRDLDPFGGSADWDGASGTTIGTEWGSFAQLFSSGGSIFAITNGGELRWYGYSDPASPDGTFDGDSGRTVGTGWNSLVTADAIPGPTPPSVLIQGIDRDGHLRQYPNIDPSTATNLAANSGTVVGDHDWLS